VIHGDDGRLLGVPCRGVRSPHHHNGIRDAPSGTNPNAPDEAPSVMPGQALRGEGVSGIPGAGGKCFSGPGGNVPNRRALETTHGMYATTEIQAREFCKASQHDRHGQRPWRLLLTCVLHKQIAAASSDTSAVNPVTQPRRVVWRTVNPNDLMIREYWL
jgi:hypothetical protein